MVDWQVTATTFYCEAVDDDITVMVYKDGSIKCTGMKKYLDNPSKTPGSSLVCEGADCERAMAYRDRILKKHNGLNVA